MYRRPLPSPAPTARRDPAARLGGGPCGSGTNHKNVVFRRTQLFRLARGACERPAKWFIPGTRTGEEDDGRAEAVSDEHSAGPGIVALAGSVSSTSGYRG